jgi:hypothetical protein
MPVELEVPEEREASVPERLPRVRRVKPPAEPVQKAAATAGARRGPRV